MVESDYSRQTVRGKALRTGYTTGSCAAAAAKAAVTALLTGQDVSEVSIRLPVGRDVNFSMHRCDWIERGPSQGQGRVLCSVIKDGGDDPDVTHGAEICVTASPSAGPGDRVRIVRGPGVGEVTRPGTGIDVGLPAVTRVPRRMITQSVLEAAQTHGSEDDSCFTVEISVPGGEEIAAKTTNSRLGVLGGISILGSTGVVQPYSTAAWRASVHLAIDVASSNELSHLVLATGTQSEIFAKRRLDLPDMAYIEAGIFSGPALKRCAMRGVKRATHVGMVGKLSKWPWVTSSLTWRETGWTPNFWPHWPPNGELVQHSRKRSARRAAPGTFRKSPRHITCRACLPPCAGWSARKAISCWETPPTPS